MAEMKKYYIMNVGLVALDEQMRGMSRMSSDSSRPKGIVWVPDASQHAATAHHSGSITMANSRQTGELRQALKRADQARQGDSTLAQRERPALPVARPDHGRVAVVLNANARRVTRGVLRRIWRLMGKDHVYFSRSMEEAEAFVREIVQKGYGTILCGGGDGTLINVINILHHYIDESNHWRKLLHERTGEVQPLLGHPRIGSLKLGTGNGLSGVLGTSSPIKNLVSVLEGKVQSTIAIPMIESENEYFYFGGMGYDAQLLNDYNWVKENFTSPFTRLLTMGLTGYFTALLSHTLPRAIMAGAAVEMRVINAGENCFYVDSRRGDRLMPVEPGAVLHQGRLTQIGAATIPFYGYGFRLYPFSGMSENLLHLRMTDIGPISAMLNLPAIWRGTYRHWRHVKDFMLDKVRIEVARPFPYQHSGEGKGYREVVEFSLSDRRVEFLDFYPKTF